MGSAEWWVDIGIATLSIVPKFDGPSFSYVPQSSFRRFLINRGCDVSWSGIDLSEIDGWQNLSHGALFLRPRDEDFDPFEPLEELRDDLHIKGNELIYQSGFSIETKEDHSAGIYQIICPQFYRPVKIDYGRVGEIDLVYVRELSGRAIITWRFNDKIDLKLVMEKIDGFVPHNSFDREKILKMALRNLPDSSSSELIKKLKTDTPGRLMDLIPDVIKIFGGFK
jgi:hypothetical protein